MKDEKIMSDYQRFQDEAREKAQFENVTSTQGQEQTFLRRSRRGAMAHMQTYYMEVLVVADESVIQFHGQDSIQSYLITLINVVDEIYRDDSLGVNLRIVLADVFTHTQTHVSKNLQNLGKGQKSIKLPRTKLKLA